MRRIEKLDNALFDHESADNDTDDLIVGDALEISLATPLKS
jgi:hypothetical protein